MEIVTNIIATLQVEGIHQWATYNDALANDPFLDDVWYLQYPHRHTWHIKLKKRVNGDDRDIEFIQFKHGVVAYLNNRYYSTVIQMLDFGTNSCEMLAKELLQEFDCVYVSVFEDGENGAECMI